MQFFAQAFKIVILENVDIFIKILVPFAIGAAIGLERQVDPTPDNQPKQGQVLVDMGLRTFSLVGILGALAGLTLSGNALISAIITSAFLILILANYILGVIFTKDLGITTEIAVFYTYFAGILIASGIVPIHVVLAVTVIVTLLLSRKKHIHSLIKDIDKSEVNSFISYAILALVILPFLPNYSFALQDISALKTIVDTTPFLNQIKDLSLFNPYKLWSIVVLMTGVDIFGYILERNLGKGKSLLITSLAGGFISSTAVTQSLAGQSKEVKNNNQHVGAALFANMTSFIQISVLILAINGALFFEGFVVIFSLILSTLITASIFFFRKSKVAEISKTEKESSSHQMFNLVPALKFMGLFLVINIVSKLALEFLGNSGFLITSGVGALAGIDAVVISASELAGKNIDYSLAIIGILIANGANLAAKTFYAFSQGAKNFAFKFGVSSVGIISASLAAAFLV